ncbi:hypothetical protein TNCV_2375441 [Trichonephila clavipes]|nr:hypothetical protein TNCV_2375441 [Trichonephila clavipes]
MINIFLVFHSYSLAPLTYEELYSTYRGNNHSTIPPVHQWYQDCLSQYFVRGGFVGYRSRASSKHLSVIFRSTGLDSSGGQKGLRRSCKMHVWVSDPQKPTAVDISEK